MSRNAVHSAGAIVLRAARNDDLPALAALERQAFPGDRLSPRQMRRHLGNPRAWFRVAAQEAVRLGDALVFFRDGSRVARLYSIVVAPEARGRGLGARLLAAAERAARARGCTRMHLEVRADNRAARALYEAHGYALRDVVPGYYEDGAPARRYSKALERAAAARTARAA